MRRRLLQGWGGGAAVQLQLPATRAAVMSVWGPWPEQHSVLQSAPIQFPVQLAQAMPSSLGPPWSVQSPSQKSPTKPSVQLQVMPSALTPVVLEARAPQPSALALALTLEL